jgi:DNA-binding SARP family transcriptional activator
MPPLSGGTDSVPVTRRGPCLALLDGFELRYGGRVVSLPLSVQRLLAFVALQEHAVLRRYVACTLWLDATEEHATSSLRSALWRLRRSGHDLIQTTGSQLRLAPGVAVDVREATAWSRRLLDGDVDEAANLGAGAYLLGELLPDWYDDWVLLERERLRELRARAFEALCEQLTAKRSFADAMQAAQAVIKLEPLRESAHRRVIRIHLAEGNQSAAIRHYRLYRRLLQRELGLPPSAQMDQLISPLVTRKRAHAARVNGGGDGVVTGA